MKNKIAIASAFIAASSFSMGEIVINDFLSFEGFVDSSYSHTDGEFAGADDNESSFGVDQVEISWLFDFDTVTAQIDLQYEGDSNEGTNEDGELVEQAFVTYHLDNGGAITAGRYASMLGFEAFEPTGLYQFSFAYDMLIGDVSVLPGYAQGVKYTQESDTTFFGISIQDEAYDLGSDQLGGNDDASTYAVEVAGSMQAGNGLTFFLGGVYEDGEEDETDSYAINAYATFETGAWIFAAEVNYGDFEDGSALASAAEEVAKDSFSVVGASAFDEQVLQFLLMANFAYSDEASVTGRFTYSDHEAQIETTGPDFAGAVEAKAMKYTLAHNYAFTDNLLLVTEVSYVDGDFDIEGLGGEDFDGVQAAVELIFSF